MRIVRVKLPPLRRIKGRRRQGGVALLATMLAVSLLTILVMDFTTSTSIAYRVEHKPLVARYSFDGTVVENRLQVKMVWRKARGWR